MKVGIFMIVNFIMGFAGFSYCAVWQALPIVLKNILHPHYYPEDGGSIFLQNINNHTLYYSHIPEHHQSQGRTKQSVQII